MNNTIISALDEQFYIECKVVATKYEYPRYTGIEKWIIITDLTEEELSDKYAEQIAPLKPYIILSRSFGEVRDEFLRNEDKHQKRAKRSVNIFDFSEDTEEHHTEIAVGSPEDDVINDEQAQILRAAIAQLKPVQRERLIKYFFYGKNLNQIAEEEGKAYSTVYESYESALKKLKKLLSTPDNLTSLSPNK